VIFFFNKRAERVYKGTRVVGGWVGCCFCSSLMAWVDVQLNWRQFQGILPKWFFCDVRACARVRVCVCGETVLFERTQRGVAYVVLGVAEPTELVFTVFACHVVTTT
jgi:hypothetical protein